MTADPEQMTGDILRLGTIATVDVADRTCTVECGDITTGPLPWLTFRAGNVVVWSPPSVGEQCLLLSPEGDTEAGLVLPALYSDAHPAPSDKESETLIQFADGCVIAYDQLSHGLRAVLPSGGTAEIVADGGITITGDVTITGNVTITGDASASGTVTGSTDVVGGGISLKNHKHGGVAAGGAQTGAPA